MAALLNYLINTWKELLSRLSTYSSNQTLVIVGALLFISAVLLKKLCSVLVEELAVRQRLVKAFEPFPCEPKHWLFGHLHLVDARSYMKIGVEWTRKYKYGFPFWYGPFRGGFECCHPETIKAVLSTAEPKDEWAYGFIKPWLGDGLLISNGPKWTRNRKLLTPGFHFEILKPYANVFNDCANVLVNKWSGLCDEGSIEISQHVRLMTLDSLMKCIFSSENNCQTVTEFNPYVKAVYDASDLIAKRFLNVFHHSDLIYYNLTADGRKFKRSIDCLHDYSRNVIKERKASLELKKSSEHVKKRNYIDFLDILLSVRDEEGRGLTEQEIQDEVDTFMFEGHDTTAAGISWCLYNLATNPEYQRKCHQETNAFFSAKGGGACAVVEWDDLNNFPYLTMCIKESLRITPAVPFLGRILTKPINLPDGRKFPKGMQVGANIYNLHHNPHVWDDPEVYDPSRFLPENVQKRSPHAFVPFSAGPRNCIGQNFAMSELKIVLSSLLHHFEFSLDDAKPVKPILGLVLQTVDGMHLRLAKRESY